MIKNVHLGFFINEYNKEPIYTDLMQFKDVNELDQFMDYFYNNNENIREFFNQDISEYSIDNIDQFKKVSEIINGNFKGRIAAYYINKLGKIEFIDLPTPKKKPIRDYRLISKLETAYEYLCKVFDEAVERINKKSKNFGPTKGEFLHYICEKLHQVSYEVSENELYYLVKYYHNPNEKNRKTCLDLLRTNVRRVYLAKAQKEYEKRMSNLDNTPKKEESKIEEISNELFEKEHLANDLYEFALSTAPKKEKELTPLKSSSNKLKYDLERAKETGDYEDLFLFHDLDELERDTNIGKGR